MSWKVGRSIAEVAYVASVALLAAAGALLQHPQYYLAAVALTLPLGLAALASVYLGYAAIQAVGGLFLATTTPDGSQAAWLSVASGGFTVGLLTASAVVNALLLRWISAVDRRGHRRLLRRG